MSMFMHESRSPLFSAGLRTDSNWYTVNVSTCTWTETTGLPSVTYHSDVS